MVLDSGDTSAPLLELEIIMKNSHSFSLVLAFTAALLAGCSSGEGEITAEGSKTPLTDGGGDDAVTVTVKDAPSDGYALDKVRVRAKPADGDATFDLACTTTDANNSGLLDTGDRLACKEGTSNDLGASLAGKDIKVELHAEVDGEDVLVGEATWTAASK